MQVRLGNSDVYFNTDKVVSVDKCGPDVVEITYDTGPHEKISAGQFDNDPALVAKMLDAFGTSPGFFRQANGNTCLHVRHAKRVLFNKDEAVVFLNAGNPKRYAAPKDIEAIRAAVGGG